MAWHKYGAKKTVVDGIRFDSAGEAELYLYLKNSETITILDLQPKIYLSKARILFKPDFFVCDNEGQYYIDFKGFRTPVFNIKKRLWKAYRSEPLHIVKLKGKKFVTVEIISGS